MGTSTATYSYDGDGMRQRKAVDGVAEGFVWDTVEGLPLLLQDGATRYVTGPEGLPLAQVSGAAVLRECAVEGRAGLIRRKESSATRRCRSQSVPLVRRVVGS